MGMGRLSLGIVLVGALGAAGCGANGKSQSKPTIGGAQAALISYDEAMQKPVEVGDATEDCGEDQLSDAVIVEEMDRHLNDMYAECVVPEYRRGRKLDTVTIDIAILGDGSVQGATVSPGSAKFKKCIAGIVEDLEFPKFSAPRMGARYQFHTS